jgi:hypothetical protein
MIRILLHFNADPKSDPTFHFDADPNPAPHLSDANLRSLVSVPSIGFILNFLRSWILISMRIRIQLLSLLRIRIRGIYNKHYSLTLFRAMLDKLDGRVPAQDGQLLLPPVQDSNGSQVTLNLSVLWIRIRIQWGPFIRIRIQQGKNYPQT